MIDTAPGGRFSLAPLLLTFVFLIGCAAPAGAPDPVEHQEGDRIRLSAGEEGIPMADWIRLAQRLTGTAYTWSAPDIESAEPIRFVGTLSFEREQFSDLFQTMLYINGFAVVPRGEGDAQVLEIVRMESGKGS